MIQITRHIKIYFCREPIDFRKGIDGLSVVCRGFLGQDPFNGSMYIFRNKRRTALKILLYDGQGFWMFVKRLSRGKFRWWPDDQLEGTATLNASQLQLLIWNGDVSLAGLECRRAN